MNPFTVIFVVLGLSVTVLHLTGNLLPELMGAAAIINFILIYRIYKDIKKSEPEWLSGITDKLLFGFKFPKLRIALIIAEILGLLTVSYALVNTFGIIK